jgi:hypothetical protein
VLSIIGMSAGPTATTTSPIGPPNTSPIHIWPADDPVGPVVRGNPVPVGLGGLFGTGLGGGQTASTYSTTTFAITPVIATNGQLLGMPNALGTDSVVTASLYLAGSSSSPFQTASPKAAGPTWDKASNAVIKVTLKSAVTATELGSVR